MKKINLNPSSQKERLELEERKWAIEKIVISLTVILALFSWLFNVKTVALFFFVILIYELFFCTASFSLYGNEPTINKISDLLVGLAFGTAIAVIIIKAYITCL